MRSRDILLAVLGLMDRQRVEGRTRFMQLAFLLVNETDVDVEYEFRRRNYGPFSDGVLHDLEQLEREDLIDIHRRTTDSGNVKYDYHVRDERGRERVAELREELDEETLREIGAVVEDHGETPIFILLDYVYREYPEFAHKRAA